MLPIRKWCAEVIYLLALSASGTSSLRLIGIVTGRGVRVGGIGDFLVVVGGLGIRY